MLSQLYLFFEDQVLRLIDDLHNMNINDLNTKKRFIMVILTIVSLLAIIYSFKLFTINIFKWVELLSNWRNLNVIGWLNLSITSLHETKFTLTCFIAIFLMFRLIYNQYINRVNAPLFDILVGAGGNIDDFDDWLDIDIDLHEPADLKINDNQNVHNGSITKHVIESVKRLLNKEKENNVIVVSQKQIYDEIRNYLMNSKHQSTIAALDILDKMYNFNNYHSATDLKEMEILRMVWQRINHPINTSRKNDLMEGLLIQLADCKYNNETMCITGRITRILQSLECVDVENIVDLKPLWAIKENIADYCSSYSDKLLKKAPQKYIDAIDIDENIRTDDQKIMANKYKECLKNNLNIKFTSLYIDTHILTSKQLNELTKNYFEYI